VILNNTPSVLLDFSVLEATFCEVERYIFRLFLGMRFEAMFFWIFGDILVDFGCQDGPEIAAKICKNLRLFFNDILMDFGVARGGF